MYLNFILITYIHLIWTYFVKPRKYNYIYLKIYFTFHLIGRITKLKEKQNRDPIIVSTNHLVHSKYFRFRLHFLTLYRHHWHLMDLLNCLHSIIRNYKSENINYLSQHHGAFVRWLNCGFVDVIFLFIRTLDVRLVIKFSINMFSWVNLGEKSRCWFKTVIKSFIN